jgi:hypothetical protein
MSELKLRPRGQVHFSGTREAVLSRMLLLSGEEKRPPRKAAATTTCLRLDSVELDTFPNYLR